MAGIYIHIPFCHKACHYCGFHFTTNLSGIDLMVESIISELNMYSEKFRPTIETLYIGGGTPSVLTTTQLRSILEAVDRNFNLSTTCELTLESNPEDLSEVYLKDLRILGINRLSIGVQTFDDELLQKINRNHSSVQALQAFDLARDCNFDNINLDLIYALPGSTTEVLTNDLTKLVQLGPEHISLYAYTIEPKTAFENWIRKGKLSPVEEDLEAEHFGEIIARLTQSGYEQYEISNFSRPGFYSRHNSAYWNLTPYLGVGPSAHSFDGNNRWVNAGTNHQYVTSISNNKLPVETEDRKDVDLINEYIFTSLRTMWGCNLDRIRQLGCDLLESRGKEIDNLVASGFLTNDGVVLKLTESGKFLADQIASDLFVENDTQ